LSCVAVHTASGISVAVGILADANIVLGISSVAGIPALASLLFVAEDGDVPIVSAAVHPTVASVLVLSCCCSCWHPC